MRKTYLAKFKIFEGEHEHFNEFLLHARNHDEAEAIARTQEHEPEILDDTREPTYWDYGDGTTAAQLLEVIEITQQEADILQRLGIINYLGQEPSEQKDKEESKKRFRVSAIGKEYFPFMEIEADTQEEAEEAYRQIWENGGFLSPKYELNVTSTALSE